jgi:PleD family two-component response regulator
LGDTCLVKIANIVKQKAKKDTDLAASLGGKLG